MWLKLLLLTLYLLFLFFLSRVLEVTSWYKDKGTIFGSFSALDPLALSVRKLKQLLDSRGVSYTGVVEKQELMELVEASGEPTEEEIADATVASTDMTVEPTNFTCGSHFYEEVEDTKDSVWLVQVVTEGDNFLLPENSWKDVIAKVSNFGIRTGVFRCSLDKRLCARKGWNSPRLILALPRGNRAKEDVILHNYMQRSSAESVLHWVRKHLASRVKTVHSLEELKEQWMTYSKDSKKSEIRVIFFSILHSCPMFLSSLAIKFTGRTKFAMVRLPSINSSYKEVLKTSSLPVYLIITPEKVFHYGSRQGESYNFRSMELFLKSFIPEINDVFLCSFLLVNVMASFELFFIYGQIWKHFLRYVVYVVKYNCTLFFVWLLILALYQFSFMATCADALLMCLRTFSGTQAASLIRNDWKQFFSYTFLIASYFAFGAISGFALRKYRWVHHDDDLFESWWFVPWDTHLTTYFFRPMVTLSRSNAPRDLDLEVGMELLIERLAVPNLWLQPVIPMDYTKDLPMWKYQGWCEADDMFVDEKYDNVCSSDDDSANISTIPNVNVVPNVQSQCTNIPTSQSKENLAKDNGKPSNAVPCPTSPVALPPIAEKCVAPTTDAERAPKGMLEFRECSICLESYKYGELLCGLPCGHNFHMTCIMLWLMRDNHCCPVCRWPSYKQKSTIPHLHFQ